MLKSLNFMLRVWEVTERFVSGEWKYHVCILKSLAALCFCELQEWVWQWGGWLGGCCQRCDGWFEIMKCCEAGEEWVDYDILRMLELRNKKQKLRLGHFDNWVDGYVNHCAGIHQRKI